MNKAASFVFSLINTITWADTEYIKAYTHRWEQQDLSSVSILTCFFKHWNWKWAQTLFCIFHTLSILRKEFEIDFSIIPQSLWTSFEIYIKKEWFCKVKTWNAKNSSQIVSKMFYWVLLTPGELWFESFYKISLMGTR